MKAILDSWQIWALGSAIFAALTTILAKVGIQNVNSNYGTFIRTIVILLFLIAILTFTHGFQSWSSISRKSQIFLVLSGFATGLSWICYFRALQLGQASQVAPIDKLSLVMIAVLGVWFLGESLSIKNWLGVALMAAGSILLIFK